MQTSKLPSTCTFHKHLFNELPVIPPHVFENEQPFPHIIIDDILTNDTLCNIQHEFNEFPEHKYMVYKNLIEDKYAFDMWKNMPITCKRVIESLNSDVFIDWLTNVTNLTHLEKDPHLHGGGMHHHPPGSKLDIHLDYSIHPLTGKERRLNCIIYVPEFWTEQTSKGCLQLWSANDDSSPKQKMVDILPKPNRMVLFQTNNISLHGLPDPVPDGHVRNSLATYYVSDAKPNAQKRLKARYFPLPTEVYDAHKAYLYSIRPNRRISEEDSNTFYLVEALLKCTSWEECLKLM